MHNGAGRCPPNSSGASGCGWRPPGGSPAATRSAKIAHDLRVEPEPRKGPLAHEQHRQVPPSPGSGGPVTLASGAERYQIDVTLYNGQNWRFSYTAFKSSGT